MSVEAECYNGTQHVGLEAQPAGQEDPATEKTEITYAASQVSSAEELRSNSRRKKELQAK